MKFILTINLILFFNYFLFSIKSETINVNWLGGEDISNCGVSSNPNCSTIKYAIEKRINDNDILFIYEGNYYSNSCNITSFDISFQIQAENVTLDCENILPAFLFDFSNNTDNGNITIKGLTIKNADNSNQESIIFSGAGITVNKGKVWIESCSFLNSFSNGSETFPRSAGIYLDSPRYLSINNSNFSNLYNTNATASAIFILNQENLTEPQTFIMESCTFNENYVETQGSTIISFSNENEVLYDYIFTNNTFENNFADYSGVFFLKIIPQENSSIIIAKNTFFNNTGQQGGITFVTMTDLYNLTIRIDGNNFTQNIGIYESSSIKFHPNAIKDWNLGSFEFVNNLIFEDNGYESNIDLSFGFNFTKFDLIIENNNFTSNIILSAAPIMISSSLIDNQVNFSFISNNFVNNTGIDTLSGGIFIYDEFALNGSQKYFFINNTFINNTGQRSAGGIMLLHPKILGGSYALFENNTFENNIGPIGGLLYYSYADSYNNTFEFVGNTFRNNIGNVYSGAIYFVLLSDFFDFNCTFTNNIFEKNTGWSGAGAIFFDFAASAQGINIELFGNTFINNSGGQGGDLSIRNDLLSTQNFSGIFEDNIFEMSSSDSGGSLFFDTLSNLSIQNCEFINNYAVEGGSILVRGQTELTINNTNFSQNNGMFGSTILSFSREKTTIINSILNTPNDSGKIGYFENIESILENTTITCGEGYIYQNSTSTKYKK